MIDKNQNYLGRYIAFDYMTSQTFWLRLNNYMTSLPLIIWRHRRFSFLPTVRNKNVCLECNISDATCFFPSGQQTTRTSVTSYCPLWYYSTSGHLSLP